MAMLVGILLSELGGVRNIVASIVINDISPG
jgi:hypothetical protein